MKGVVRCEIPDIICYLYTKACDDLIHEVWPPWPHIVTNAIRRLLWADLSRNRCNSRLRLDNAFKLILLILRHSSPPGSKLTHRCWVKTAIRLPSDEVLPAPTLNSRLCNLSSRRRPLGRTSFKASNKNADVNRCARRHQGFDPAPTPSSHSHQHSTNPSKARKQNYSIEVKLRASSALCRTWPATLTSSGAARWQRAAAIIQSCAARVGGDGRADPL